MGLFKIWKDHVTQYSNRYREVQNADGTITHEAVEGEVVQEGTPQNAQNFNDLEERVLSAGLIANLAMLKLGAAESRIKGLQGEIVEATLTNTKSYPFNNSKKTLALTTPRGNLDYTVNVEAEAKDAGGVGEIRITDKQLNGFKIEYTGAAKEVTVKCTVQGGYHRKWVLYHTETQTTARIITTLTRGEQCHRENHRERLQEADSLHGITITICRALRTLTATFGSGPVDYALWTEKFRLSLMVTL